LEHLFYLSELMESEVSAYKELLALTQQEKDAVTKNDVQALSSIVEQQQSALAVIKKLEAEKQNLLAGIRADAGMPGDKLRLKDAIMTARGELREKLQGLARELESTAARLRRAGTVNRMLINAQLQYTSICLNLMTGRGSTPGTYSGSGRMDEGCAANPSLMDQTV
jgi:flagellar biosynthesis/type III secretory pathway chaperone